LQCIWDFGLWCSFSLLLSIFVGVDVWIFIIVSFWCFLDCVILYFAHSWNLLVGFDSFCHLNRNAGLSSICATILISMLLRYMESTRKHVKSTSDQKWVTLSYQRINHLDFAKHGRSKTDIVGISLINMIKINILFLLIGFAIFARKERWPFVEGTAHKMVKLQSYDQAPLKVF
jgi:hypothetical protein